MTRIYLVVLSLFSFYSVHLVYSQSVKLSVSTKSVHTIATQNGTFTVNGKQLSFSNGHSVEFDLWAVNPRKTHIITYKNGTDQAEITLFDESGTKLNTFNITAFDLSDESLAVFLYNQLIFGFRHSIGSFEFYNWDGRFINTLSNKAGSSEGEKVSTFGIQNQSFSILTSNPMIQMQGFKNTAAALLNPFINQKQNLAYESNAENISVTSSINSNRIVLVHGSSSKNSVLKITNRLGEVLHSFDVDVEDPIGASLDFSGDYVTIYNSGRMAVFKISTEERVGSSSVRGTPLFHAFYDAKEQILIGLTGVPSASGYTNLGVQAVHLGKRKIVKDETTNSVNILAGHPVYPKKNKTGNYELIGFNGIIQIKAIF